MTQAQALKQIKKLNWYRQGGTIFSFYSANAYRAAFKHFSGFNYFRGKNNYGYFNKDKERIIAKRFISQTLNCENYLLTKYIKPWRKLVKQRTSLVNKYKEELLNLSVNKLEYTYKKIRNIDFKIWYYGIVIEALDPWGEMLIAEQLNSFGCNISKDDLAILCAPDKLTFIQQEKLDLLKLSKFFSNQKILTKKLVTHANKYFFVNNSWANVERLDENYFNKKLIDLLRFNKTGRNKEFVYLTNYTKHIRAQKNALYSKLKIPSKLRRVFKMFAIISDWRDERKAETLKMNDFYHEYLLAIQYHTNIPIKYLYYLTEFEADSIARIIKLREELKKRSQSCFYYVNNDKYFIWTGKSAERLRKAIQDRLSSSSELSGVVAAKGVVTGRVVVVIHKEDFKKIKLGDILVTQMTRPEFVNVLKLVSGIITDEGGVTCHAAIISREMGLPCIIGTQIATSTLKTGDRVILDANQGIIKLL